MCMFGERYDGLRILILRYQNNTFDLSIRHAFFEDREKLVYQFRINPWSARNYHLVVNINPTECSYTRKPIGCRWKEM